MTRRVVAPVEGQLVFAVEVDLPPAVEQARAIRRAAGLQASLTKPEVLSLVRTVLEAEYPTARSSAA